MRIKQCTNPAPLPKRKQGPSEGPWFFPCPKKGVIGHVSAEAVSGRQHGASASLYLSRKNKPETFVAFWFAVNYSIRNQKVA